MTTVTAVDALAAVGWLADQRATGVLRGPAGAVYFTDGLVVHAESDLAPDLAVLLTRSGRIAPEAWHEVVGAFGPYGLVAGALVDQRRLTRGELEVSHLGVLFDAAYCVLTAGRVASCAGEAGLRTGRPGGGAPGGDGFGRGGSSGGGQVVAEADDGEPGTEDWLFEPGVRHWLGPVSAVSAKRLCREVERRRRLLDRIWPWPQLDAAPVCPTGVRGAVAGPGDRAGRQRPPTRRQCELLDQADGRRTPAELARLLGRSAFATTADVRRLAAAGLVATPGRNVPRPAPRHAARPAAEPVVRTTGVQAAGVPAGEVRDGGARAAEVRGPGGQAAGRAAPGRAGGSGPDSGQATGGGGVVGAGPVAEAGPTAAVDQAVAAGQSAGTGQAPTADQAAGTGQVTGAGQVVGAGQAVAGRTVGGLHRRVPGAALAGLLPPAARSARPPTPIHPPTPAAAHPLTVTDPDIALLTRVRTLLEARL
ncbi:hypothetical protein ACF9IK_05800 [Kitasatospora hibisci]|uniref:hypothetical protein n=1 Tax=Kitasatospora hibisci TaxID=3369522 RepID=UPI003754781F